MHLLRCPYVPRNTLDFPMYSKITGTLEQCLKSRTYSVIVLAISEQDFGTRLSTSFTQILNDAACVSSGFTSVVGLFKLPRMRGVLIKRWRLRDAPSARARQ